MSKTIKELTKQCIGFYNIIDSLVPYLIHEKNNLSLHNKIASNNGENLSPDSFVGTLACGATCWVMHHMLKHNNIETKMMKKSVGSGDYYQDHCFLLYNETIIIDPTYKQFFTECVYEKNKYTDVLFNKCPFVFIGDIANFKTHYQTLNKLHKEKYETDLEVSVSDFWEGYYDYSSKLNLKPDVKLVLSAA